MIKLKHLAGEFKMDAQKVRRILRAKGFGPQKANKRWEWEENDPILEECRKALKE